MSLNKIFPVIVVYRCQLEEAIAYKSLISKHAFCEFMVYDNSPTGYNFDEALLPSNAVYVRDVYNGGVSKAYNTAAKYATQQGYTHLLLLDQDTQFLQDISQYVNHIEQYPEMLCAPILVTKQNRNFSPCNRKGLRTKAMPMLSGVYSLNEYMPVNSGMCIPLKYFNDAGGYNDAVVLDFADFEFLTRYRHLQSVFKLLPLTAIQDFSNEERAIEKLLTRYKLYLKSAKATKWDNFRERTSLNIEVLCHTLALSLRVRSVQFFMAWFKSLF